MSAERHERGERHVKARQYVADLVDAGSCLTVRGLTTTQRPTTGLYEAAEKWRR
ncbi:hypothetical protein [Streptomyces sp. NPDC002133]|uniref:hypothetical protein n=1 Tax=Streptomyces sp. NPDC002133 TaxID=3154409 RepID=UPI00333359CD